VTEPSVMLRDPSTPLGMTGVAPGEGIDAAPLALKTDTALPEQPTLLWQTPRHRHRRSPSVHNATMCVHISSGFEPTRICPMTHSLRIGNPDPSVTTGMDVVEQRQQFI